PLILLEADLLGDLQAVGSAGVIHPDFAGAERSERYEVPAREDETPVRRPRRAVDEPLLLLRHLFQVAALRVHRPDVPETAAIARERDARAVGAEARLHL